MATVQHIQSSFSEGRISPRLHGQIDIPSYGTSAKTLENFIVLPQGSVTRRPGTYYVTDASTHIANESKLVPFYYGSGQSYIIEFYADTIKFFTNNGVLGTNASSGSTPFTLANTGYTASEIADIRFIQSADVLFIAHPSHKPRKLERTLPISGETGYSARAIDGSYWVISDIDFIDGPYDEVNVNDSYKFKITESSLDNVDIGGLGIDTALDAFVNSSHGLQSGQKIYLYNPGSGTGAGNLVTDDSNSAFVYFTSGSDNGTATTQGNCITYWVVNPTATTFQISASATATTPITFKLEGTESLWTGSLNAVKIIISKDTTTAVLTATGHTPFTYSGSGTDTTGVEIGKLWRVNVLAGTDRNKIKGIRWTSIKITQVTSTSTAIGTLQEDCILDDTNSIEWQRGVFNATDGFPRDVSIYQQRLVFAGTNKYPATIWFSKTADFFNYASSELLGSSTGNVDPTGAVILGEQILDDNALTFTIDSDTVDKIQWLSEGTKLAIGTTGGVFLIYGSEQDLTITPFNFTIVKESAYPAGSADALSIGQKMIYVQQNERKLREIATRGEQQAEYGALNLTLRSEDITYTGVKELTFQEQPFSVVWGRLGNGKLIALTHESSLNMFAWTTHTIGGTFDNNVVETSDAVKIAVTNFTGDGLIVTATITITSYASLSTSDYFILTDKYGIPKKFNCGGAGSSGTDHDTWMTNESNDTTADNIYTMLNQAGNETWTVANPAANVVTITRDRNEYDDNAVVESIATIPEDNRSQTWMILKRTIDGVTQRYIEFMERYHDAQEIAQVDSHFVDSGLKTFNTTAFTSASGYNHLEGETLSVLGDGAVQADQTVVSGQIGSVVALTSSNTITAGFAYTSELVTLPMTKGEGGGSFIIGMKRMIKINIKMLNSLGLKFSMEGSEYEELVFRNPSVDLYGNMVPLFTGNMEMAPIARSFESEGVSFQCTQPFPFTILYIAQQYEVNF